MYGWEWVREPSARARVSDRKGVGFGLALITQHDVDVRRYTYS
jgi:hypothetical protein